MKLSVLNVAYPLAPVGIDAVGGAEQVLARLDLALTRAGHQSIVLACEGSTTAGELVPVPLPKGGLTDAVRDKTQRAVRKRIEDLLCTRRIDLVHLHGVDCLHYLPDTTRPVLVTLHLPPHWYPSEIFDLERPNVYLQCVSQHQHRACPPTATLLPPIENGVALDVLRPHYRKCRYAFALGRICPEKGFHHALNAARDAHIPLLLAGRVFRYAEHEEYFRQEIEPRLDRQRRFIGPVACERKRRLLAGARCLIVPSLVSETSSLVTMEALACGTPVIAFRAGALPEAIEHGRTGFLVQDEREMAEAIEASGNLDFRTCRETAESRFSAEQMCRRYLDLYENLAGCRSALASDELRVSAPAPPAEPGLTVEELTSFPALESIAAEWNDLWRRQVTATPFQSPAWLIPWARHFRPAELWTLVVRHGGRLAAVAPMFIHTEENSRRKLLLLGAGNSDYVDILAAPEYRDPAVSAILDRILQHRARWNTCHLQPLRENATLLTAQLSGRTDRNPIVQDVCPVLTFPLGATSLGEFLPAEQWRKLQYYRRRAERTGQVVLETAQPENFAELFSALLYLHQARWAMRGQPGVLAEDQVHAFHREAAANLLNDGLLRLSALRIDGRLIAAFYGISHQGVTYYYVGGFDPELKQFSPGVLLLGAMIEAALREGCVSFDFLRGNERYKYAWGARDHYTYSLRFTNG